MRMLDLIEKKKIGLAHTPDELAFIAQAAARGSVPDYQLSSWLMAVCWRGMETAETAALTRAMAASGRRLDLGSLRGPKVDKHSTGGVGDGISIPLAPLAAAAGLVVPMMSGRGLGHTGGTLDKLESIRGFKVALPPAAILRQLRAAGVSLFGQSADLAPADRKLYGLRDVTATVGADPLIVSSILSKKLSEDLDALVLDVKVGPGAIYPEPAKMRALAGHLVRTANHLGLKTVAVLTRMEEPLGRAVGNAIEIRQALEVLGGGGPSDFVEVLLVLGGWMLALGGKARNWEEGAEILEALRRSGAGLKRFREIVKLQGGDVRAVDDPDRFLPLAKHSIEVKATASGRLAGLDARSVGKLAVRLGAGRQKAEDKVDFGAGLFLNKKRGDRVKKGDLLARLYASDAMRLEGAAEEFRAIALISARPVRVQPPVIGVVKG
jgi:pyrimidine-nucleoside phosphorylase